MKNRHFNESFKHASNGIIQAFKTENNIKRHTLAGSLAVFAGIYFRITVIEWFAIVIVIGFVIVAELLNTAIEYTVDMVCGDTYNELAKYSKDIAAGATLVAAVTAVAVGMLVFLPDFLGLIINL